MSTFIICQVIYYFTKQSLPHGNGPYLFLNFSIIQSIYLAA